MSPYPEHCTQLLRVAGFHGGDRVKLFQELCQRSRADGELEVSSVVSKLILVPSRLPKQDLFANNSFQILPGFLIPASICGIALKQILLGRE